MTELPLNKNNFLHSRSFSNFEIFIKNFEILIPLGHENFRKKSIKGLRYYDIIDIRNKQFWPKIFNMGDDQSMIYYNHSVESFLRNFFSTSYGEGYRERILCLFIIINRVKKKYSFMISDVFRFYLVSAFIVEDLYDDLNTGNNINYHIPSVDELFFFFGEVEFPPTSYFLNFKCYSCGGDGVIDILEKNNYREMVCREQFFIEPSTTKAILKKIFPKEYCSPFFQNKMPIRLGLKLVQNRHNAQIQSWFSSFLFSFKKLTGVDIPLLCSEMILSYIYYYSWDIVEEVINFNPPKAIIVDDYSIFKYTENYSSMMKCDMDMCNSFTHTECCYYVVNDECGDYDEPEYEYIICDYFCFLENFVEPL